MKTNALILLIVVMATFSASAQRIKKTERVAEKETKDFLYELECAGVGKQGTYLLKVWSYSKRKDVAIDQAKKNAVHGVVFKGFASGGKQQSGDACRGQRALANTPNIEDDQKAYFKKFFKDGGDYMRYVSSSDQVKTHMEVIKLSGMKRVVDMAGIEYKVGVIVTVMKDELRKHLEKDGVIRGLNSGF